MMKTDMPEKIYAIWEIFKWVEEPHLVYPEEISSQYTRSDLCVPRSEYDKLKQHADRLADALELPDKMVDADMMFGLSEYDYLPYETVQNIARQALRIVGQRNKKALAEYRKETE